MSDCPCSGRGVRLHRAVMGSASPAESTRRQTGDTHQNIHTVFHTCINTPAPGCLARFVTGLPAGDEALAGKRRRMQEKIRFCPLDVMSLAKGLQRERRANGGQGAGLLSSTKDVMLFQT